MSQPEEVESLLPYLEMGEDEHEGSSETCVSPEGNVRLLVASKVELFAEVEKVLHWLSEVYKIANGVKDREEKSRESTDPVMLASRGMYWLQAYSFNLVMMFVQIVRRRMQ